MRKKRIAPMDEEEDLYDLPVMFRTSRKKYRLLARLSHRRSQNKVIDALLFPNGWQQRLGMLEKKHRAAGIPDEEFLHSKEKREQGIVVKPGPRSSRGQ